MEYNIKIQNHYAVHLKLLANIYMLVKKKKKEMLTKMGVSHKDTGANLMELPLAKLRTI